MDKKDKKPDENKMEIYLSLFKEPTIPLWAKILLAPPMIAIMILIDAIEEFKCFILGNKDIIVIFGVFAALSVYLQSVSEMAAAYSLILLLGVSLVLLYECMSEYEGILKFPLILILFGIVLDIYSYSTSTYSTTVNTFILQIVSFCVIIVGFAASLIMISPILTYLTKKIIKKDTDSSKKVQETL